MNPRLFLIEVAKSCWFKLNKEWGIAYLKEINSEIAHIIEREKQKIKRLINNSICRCHSCFATDRDMTYNPKSKAWFCINCYQEQKEFHTSKGFPQLFL